MMQPRLAWFVIVVSILIIFVVFELIRRGKLREEYSLVWLFGALIIFLMTVFRGTLRSLADLLQVEYAPSFIFMVVIAVLVLIQLAHTTAVSFLTSRNRDLAQKFGILELGVRQLYSQVQQLESKEFSRVGLAYVHFISRELRDLPHITDFMRRTLELTIELVGANSGSLLFFGENGQLVENLMLFEGKSFREQVHEIGDTVEKGLSGWVFANRQPALVANTLEDPRWVKRPWEHEQPASRSALCVPLEVNGRVAGVLTLVSLHASRFTEQDLLFLVAVSAIIIQTSSPMLEHLKEGIRIVQPAEDALENQTV
ncbi:MAG TPA: DUF2304 family protein [Anaerolineaceae bacterium]|nr:DUF2304 family protein [Anaerolineaceae bacterium]